MAHQTAATNDLKWLRSGASYAWLAYPLFAAFLTVMGILHLFMAASWAGLVNLNFSQALQGWLKGIDFERQYSGIYLKAMEQFDVASMMLGVAIFMLTLSFLNRQERHHKARLLAVIEGQEGQERLSSQA